MKKSLLAALAFAAMAFYAMPAAAQATRTWVSGVGDDANPCSRTAPCKTFAGAISKTAAGGIINCLDPGGFGTVTITKSMTIDCTGINAGLLASGGIPGITINAAASDKVTLRNLDIESTALTPGNFGVNVLSAATVLVDHCRIWGFKSSGGAGIRVSPPTNAVELHVKDTIIYDNGSLNTGGGILLTPASGVAVKGSLSRVELRDNAHGINSAATGTPNIRMHGVDVVLSGNGFDGIHSVNPAVGGAIASFFFDRSSFVGNGGYGVYADGTSYVVLGNSTITYNSTGVGIVNGASVYTYGNNQNDANIGGNGAPNAALVQD
jgi:hypothetical protein